MTKFSLSLSLQALVILIGFVSAPFVPCPAVSCLAAVTTTNLEELLGEADADAFCQCPEQFQHLSLLHLLGDVYSDLVDEVISSVEK